MATQPDQKLEQSRSRKALERIDVADAEHWEDGPPHGLFGDLRGKCPVHWSEINEYPEEGGFWSVTRADDVREVATGYECGIGLANFHDIAEGDIIECFTSQSVSRSGGN